jgi:hypothetical protein
MQDSTLNKLILLFVFEKMEIPVSEETLVELCSSDNEWIPNYLECKETLLQLLDAGFVYATNTNAQTGPLYTITPDGRVCLAHFFIRIPSSIREDITEFTKENRVRYRKKQEYLSDYKKNPDGSYTVNLKIIEPAQPVLEINLVVPDRHKAKWIFQNWKENAPQVYASLYSQLVE